MTFGLVKGKLLHYGQTVAVVDMFFGYWACFVMVCSCLHCVALLWHNSLSTPSWVLAAWI